MNTAAAITLRPAVPGDFPFCEAIYFTEMDQIMTDLGMDKTRHRETFKAGWRAAQVQIIQEGGRDIGWLQTWPEPDSLYLSQLFIDAACQNRGLGAQVLARLLGQTDAQGVATTLSVVKSNPARRLYERHGFALTHEDERKFYMRREVGCGGEADGGAGGDFPGSGGAVSTDESARSNQRSNREIIRTTRHISRI